MDYFSPPLYELLCFWTLKRSPLGLLLQAQGFPDPDLDAADRCGFQPSQLHPCKHMSDYGQLLRQACVSSPHAIARAILQTTPKP